MKVDFQGSLHVVLTQRKSGLSTDAIIKCQVGSPLIFVNAAVREEDKSKVCRRFNRLIRERL